jgi:hypothetical protein
VLARVRSREMPKEMRFLGQADAADTSRSETIPPE